MGPTATSPQKKQAFLQATKKECSNVTLRQFKSVLAQALALALALALVLVLALALALVLALY